MKTPNKQTGTRHSRAIAQINRHFDRIKGKADRRLARRIAADTAHAILQLRRGEGAMEWSAGSTQMEDIRPARPLITVAFNQAHNHHGPFTVHA